MLVNIPAPWFAYGLLKCTLGVPENLCVSSRCVFVFLHIGQVSGQALVDLLNHAKENGYAASLKVLELGVVACLIGYSKLPWGLSLVSLGNGYRWGYI
jgi:hypothetical protein